MSSTITLKDLKSIKRSLKALPGRLSEYSAANLYLFRDVHEYRLEGDFIRGKTRTGQIFYMPLKFPFNPEKNRVYFPISEEGLDGLNQKKINHFALDADDDYFFERRVLQEMPGRKLSSRRSLIYRFEEDYDPKIVPLDKKGAIKVLDAWAEEQSDPSDYESCLEAIHLLDELCLYGLSVMSGKKHVGFIIAETLRSDTALFHFAKAYPGIKGITPFMYRAMAARLPDKIKWINLEQDLGLPGLRRAKQAYQPAKLLKKFYIQL